MIDCGYTIHKKRIPKYFNPHAVDSRPPTGEPGLGRRKRAEAGAVVEAGGRGAGRQGVCPRYDIPGGAGGGVRYERQLPGFGYVRCVRLGGVGGRGGGEAGGKGPWCTLDPRHDILVLYS